MRLWHYKLIPYLDDKHLLAQWREVIAIKRKIDKYGSPNHLIVNRVMDYSLNEFIYYAGLVITEMTTRGFKINPNLINEIYEFNNKNFKGSDYFDFVFDGWHNDEYLLICYYNLLEKYQCRPSDEQKKMIDNVRNYLSSKKLI